MEENIKKFRKTKTFKAAVNKNYCQCHFCFETIPTELLDNHFRNCKKVVPVDALEERLMR